MKEKILIIAVPVLDVENIPYGPAVLNGLLKTQNYRSMVWDLNIDLYQEYRDNWNEIVNLLGNRAYRPSEKNSLSVKSVLSKIRKLTRRKIEEVKPDSILLSVFSSQSLDAVIFLSSIIKEISPNSYVLVGGRGLDNTERNTKLNYAEYYSHYLPVDCWYLGDAENKLIEVIESKPSGVFYSPPVNSNELEKTSAADWYGYTFEYYKGYAEQKIRMPITGSKGCVRQCTFCDVAGSWPKFIYRKGESLGKEIIDTYFRTGINKFEFTDNLVNGSVTNFREMNTYIADRLPNTLDYKGYAICRPKNTFPKSDFQLAKSAGASLFKVGIESGSERVRHDMKKKFSNEDIMWFSENCYEQGIKQLWLMFVGYPNETEEDFQESIRLLKNHRHLNDNGNITVFLSLPMMLTSGSGFMRKYGSEYGLMHNNSDPWGDFFWTSKIYTDNTFAVRVSRWKRFTEAIIKYGYADEHTRQAEKFLEIEGLEEIYKERYSSEKKVIPIHKSSVNINKETHV